MLSTSVCDFTGAGATGTDVVAEVSADIGTLPRPAAESASASPLACSPSWSVTLDIGLSSFEAAEEDETPPPPNASSNILPAKAVESVLLSLCVEVAMEKTLPRSLPSTPPGKAN